MIRMYPDGIVEGSPEEVAAFKHIDAALTLRNARPTRQRQRALPAPKKIKSSRPSTDQAKSQAVRDWANANGKPVGTKGRIPQDVLDAYEAAQRTGESIEGQG
jgi:hypothetical protein